MFYRLIRHGLILSIGLCPALAFAQVEIKRVWPVHRTAESFTTIGEYFGVSEGADNRTALRSQPDQRTGYYWLTRTNSDQAHLGSVVQLEVTRAGSTESTTYLFDWDMPEGSNAVFIGLTGTDWADPEEAPIAWRLTVLDANGKSLASQNSFLWGNPTS